MDAEVFRIALSIVKKVGSVRARQLIHHFGSAERVLKASSKDLLQVKGVSKVIADSIKDKDVLEKAKMELDFIKENKIKLLYFMDDEYPNRLKVYDDAPICLFYRGNAPLNGRKHVSIVGTRKPTEKGKWIAEKIVEELSNQDVSIISGLAYGVDITAHKASIAAGLPTIGVVAHGLDTIYPSAHKQVAREMTKNGGVLTEFVRSTKPDRDRFPARNRIIAMLADALIVVESKESGGSMITANFANDYNKDVFAIPGRIDDSFSKGCNKLIKEHKAQLLESAEELVSLMRWEPKTEKEVQRAMFFDLTRDEQKIIDAIKAGLDTIDVLAGALALSQSELASLLLELEFKGLLRSLPGKKYLVLQ